MLAAASHDHLESEHEAPRAEAPASDTAPKTTAPADGLGDSDDEDLDAPRASLSNAKRAPATTGLPSADDLLSETSAVSWLAKPTWALKQPEPVRYEEISSIVVTG